MLVQTASVNVDCRKAEWLECFIPCIIGCHTPAKVVKEDEEIAGPHIYEKMCCDRTNKDNQEKEKLGSENAEKARDLEKQVNPYEWVSTVEDNGYLYEYGSELTGGRISVDHSSFTTAVRIHGG